MPPPADSDSDGGADRADPAADPAAAGAPATHAQHAGAQYAGGTGPITGPKAADVTLFGDDDCDDHVVDAAAMLPPVRGTTAAKQADAGGPLPAAVPPPATPVVVVAPPAELEYIRPSRNRMLITELSDTEADESGGADEIPEEIAPSSRSVGKDGGWFSVAAGGSTAQGIKFFFVCTRSDSMF